MFNLKCEIQYPYILAINILYHSTDYCCFSVGSLFNKSFNNLKL